MRTVVLSHKALSRGTQWWSSMLRGYMRHIFLTTKSCSKLRRSSTVSIVKVEILECFKNPLVSIPIAASRWTELLRHNEQRDCNSSSIELAPFSSICVDKLSVNNESNQVLTHYIATFHVSTGCIQGFDACQMERNVCVRIPISDFVSIGILVTALKYHTGLRAVGPTPDHFVPRLMI